MAREIVATLTTYKGYTIETESLGASCVIYLPGTWDNKISRNYVAAGPQSMSAAKFWINSDIAQRMGKEKRGESK
jgi:hypothetical protein